MIINVPPDKVGEAKAKAIAQEKLLKQDKEEAVRINCIQRTDLKAVYSRLYQQVDLALKAAENSLEDKRNNLRKTLLEDESCLTHEYVEKAQKYAQKLNEEKKIRAEAIVEKHEKERQEFVQKMFRNLKILNCDELRKKKSLEGRKMLSNAHKLQILEKQQLKEREKEIDRMYINIITNENLYDPISAAKRKKFMDRLETDEYLKKQMYGRILAKDEEKMMKLEENQYWYRLAEQMREEDRINLERKHKLRSELRETLLNQIEFNKQLQMRRQRWEDEMDKILIEDLQREAQENKEGEEAMKEETAQELQDYSKVWEEFRQFKKNLDQKEEAELNKVRQEKLDEIKDFRVKKHETQKNTAKDIMAFWSSQIQEKKQLEKELKEKMADDRKFYETFNIDLDKIRNLQKRDYAKQIQKDLDEQIEYKNRMQEMEKTERIRSEKQALADTEAKLVECVQLDASDMKMVHPFYKVLFPAKL